MGWGIGNDFNKATGAATPRYAAAAQAQGRLDTAEQARIDAIRSGNMTGAAEIGNAYMDSPEMQAGVKGFFGGTPTAPVTKSRPNRRKRVNSRIVPTTRKKMNRFAGFRTSQTILDRTNIRDSDAFAGKRCLLACDASMTYIIRVT